jgi:ABC-2 type transport system permease protein
VLSPVAILLALPALALATALRFLYTYSLALAGFWTQQAHGVVALGEVLVFLLGGLAAPIAFFPTWARGVAGILPFAAMLGFPAQVASGGLDGTALLVGYALQAAWVFTLGVGAALIWRRGVRHYTAVGG